MGSIFNFTIIGGERKKGHKAQCSHGGGADTQCGSYSFIGFQVVGGSYPATPTHVSDTTHTFFSLSHSIYIILVAFTFSAWQERTCTDLKVDVDANTYDKIARFYKNLSDVGQSFWQWRELFGPFFFYCSVSEFVAIKVKCAKRETGWVAVDKYSRQLWLYLTRT